MNMRSKGLRNQIGIAAAALTLLLALPAGGCAGPEMTGREMTEPEKIQTAEQNENENERQTEKNTPDSPDEARAEEGAQSGSGDGESAEAHTEEAIRDREAEEEKELGQEQKSVPEGQRDEAQTEKQEQKGQNTETPAKDREGGSGEAFSEEAQGEAKEAEALAEEKLASMTLEEKLAQMFFITPEALTGVSSATRAGETTKSSFSLYPVGGLVFFENNIQTPEQIIQMNQGLTEISLERIGVIPFLGVDEEGGTVLRIADNPQFSREDVGNMSELGSTGDPQNAYEAGRTLGTYLSEYGFNLDFAPVADLWNNPENQVVKYRSFGSDSALVSEMVKKETEGLKSCGISAVLKHFPGHGSTAADSHKGAAVSLRTEEELAAEEYLPFRAGIEAGAEFIMAGHLSFPNIEGQDIPATLSYHFLTEVLREELQFQGIIITDAMNMAAIANYYTSAEAAVAAVKAGADMILMPADFENAYRGLLEAVQNGEISENRINDSVKRILVVKYNKMSE